MWQGRSIDVGNRVRQSPGSAPRDGPDCALSHRTEDRNDKRGPQARDRQAIKTQSSEKAPSGNGGKTQPGVLNAVAGSGGSSPKRELNAALVSDTEFQIASAGWIERQMPSLLRI